MKTPAAMARIARIGARPPIEIKADKPVRMSQMANNTKPIFLLNFMIVSFLIVRKRSKDYPAFETGKVTKAGITAR
jgi:hypothetical protein